jgi:hypothetical protein
MGRSGAKGVRSHPKDDGDVRVGDVNTLDQRPNDITAQAPICIGEPGADVGRELLHLTHYQPELVQHASFVDLTRQRFLELGNPLPQTDDARLKFLFGEKALGVAVDEASEALAQFAEVDRVGAVSRGRRGRLQRVPAPRVLLFDAAGILE